jgi:hypothetical protein
MTRTIAIFLELPESAELMDDIADDAADDADDAADDSTIILLYGYIIIWEV